MMRLHQSVISQSSAGQVFPSGHPFNNQLHPAGLNFCELMGTNFSPSVQALLRLGNQNYRYGKYVGRAKHLIVNPSEAGTAI